MKNLLAGAKVFLCVAIPVYAGIATLRVLMTYAGLDRVTWSDWFHTLIGPGGVNLLLPAGLVVVLVASGFAERVWRGVVTAVKRVPSLLAKVPPVSTLTITVWGLVIIGFPLYSVATSPQAWAHWAPWWVLLAFSPLIFGFAYGFIYKPKELVDAISELRARRNLIAFGVKIVVIIGASWFIYGMHNNMAHAGILWVVPSLGALVPLMLGNIASGIVRGEGRANKTSPAET